VRIKVDENIGCSGVELLRRAGHDVMTVAEQGLGGSTDQRIFDVCVAEHRTLITLDRGFGHVSRFPPKQTVGLVILELGGPASLRGLHNRLRDFLALAAARSVNGEFWIVEPGRVRVRLEKDRE
jgi:predicted nuclease of predicted toxin-antitoxin system